MRAAIGTSHTQVVKNIVNGCLRLPYPEPNIYDACLLRDAQLWNQLVAHGGLSTICCPQGRKKYTQKPWIAMPKEGRRFKPISILPIADIVAPYDGTDQLVMTERVPFGYDGVITDVVCELTSASISGFVEGSGDITWRLSAQGEVGSTRRFLRDLGNIQVTLGSLITPSPTPRGGLRVYSGDLIIWSIALAAGAEARINPEANVVCSITGWWYPR